MLLSLKYGQEIGELFEIFYFKMKHSKMTLGVDSLRLSSSPFFFGDL